MNILSQAATYYSVFQPLIHSETGELAGHEALLRSTTNDTPEYLFRTARSAGCLNELDVWSMKRAVFSYFGEPLGKCSDQLLFVNVFPSTLLNPSFTEFSKEILRYQLPVGQIVLEINEASEEEKMWDIPLLVQKIREMRQYGFLIALDDVGSGAASLTKIVEYEPDIVKVGSLFRERIGSESEQTKTRNSICRLLLRAKQARA